MPTPLVSVETLAEFSNADFSSFNATYLNNLCLLAHSLCAKYLRFDPSVQTYTNENGPVMLNKTGRLAGTTYLRLTAQPLTTVDASCVTQLLLLYAPGLPTLDVLAQAVQTPVPTVSATQRSGMLLIAWMGLGIMGGFGFQYGAGQWGGVATTGAIQYQATYSAGYAISSADQSAFPTALPVPVDLQMACAQVVEVLAGQAARVAESVQNAVGGVLSSFKNLDVEERYQLAPLKDKDVNTILRGTQQGMWAAAHLDDYKRTTAERVFLL